jgi:uncharacterized membrane protein
LRNPGVDLDAGTPRLNGSRLGFHESAGCRVTVATLNITSGRAAMNMSESHRIRWETIGMVAGITVFLAGIVLLILVFGWTYNLFLAAPRTMVGTPLTAIGRIASQIALLFVMGYVASLIGSKGLQLYGVCRGVSPR